jgi:DNA-binding transcriptional ArsR family regulator
MNIVCEERKRAVSAVCGQIISIKVEISIDSRPEPSHFDKHRRMDMQGSSAVIALGALAQEHRLAVFRLLVQAGGDGLPAGAIAEALGIPGSSLSFHLAQLNRSGLIQKQRRSRSLIYRADFAAMNDLIAYLLENCCSGAACAPNPECTAPAAPTGKRKSR